MKILLIPLLLILLSMGCKKTVVEIDKLPPATQTGANTFGCLVNGKAWTPNGFEYPYSNFRLDIDPSFDSGLFLLRVYNLDNASKTKINIGSTVIKKTGSYSIDSTSHTSIDIQFESCSTTTITSFYSSGLLKITNYNIEKGIFSGEFYCKIKSPYCIDTVHITNGRFDKKL